MYFTDDSLLPENHAAAHDHGGTVWPCVDAVGLHSGAETAPYLGRTDPGCGRLLQRRGNAPAHPCARSQDRPHLEELQGIRRADRAAAQGRAQDDPAGRRVHLVCTGAWAKRRSSGVTMPATSCAKLTPSRIRSRSPAAPRFTIIRRSTAWTTPGLGRALRIRRWRVPWQTWWRTLHPISISRTSSAVLNTASSRASRSPTSTPSNWSSG